MNKFKLIIIIVNLTLMLSMNNIFKSFECKIEDAKTFLDNKIGTDHLNNIITPDAAELAIRFMAKGIGIDQSKEEINTNKALYLKLIEKGQKYVNDIIKEGDQDEKLKRIPGYNWKEEYKNWLSSEDYLGIRKDYRVIGNENFLDYIIKNTVLKTKKEIDKINKLEKFRIEFLQSIISIQSYFFALAQTQMLEYKGFSQGTFSILEPYKSYFKKIQKSYLDLILTIQKIEYPYLNDEKLIGYEGIGMTSLQAILAPNSYSYYRMNSHGFNNSTGIDLLGLEYNKFNNKDERSTFDWMYKFRHILMGENEDQFWWKPEAHGLGNYIDVFCHTKDLMAGGIPRICGLSNESKSDLAKERPISEYVKSFKEIVPSTKYTHIKDIYNALLVELNKLHDIDNERSEKIKNLIKDINKNYTHISKRWGQEIILSKEDFITSYLGEQNIDNIVKQYIHYFINTRRVLKEFQRHFNDNKKSIRIIRPTTLKQTENPEYDEDMLTIIGHRIGDRVELESNDPIEFIKNELKNFSCLTEKLDIILKSNLNKKIYNYLNKVKNKINNIFKENGVNNIIKYNNIFEIK